MVEDNQVAGESQNDPDWFKVVSTTKSCGGYVKVVEHQSRVNDCKMTLAIFLPEDKVENQRSEPYPAIYYLDGLTGSHEQPMTKMNYAAQCKKREVVLVFADTSPRHIDATCPEAGNDDIRVGYGAGHNCDATK